MIPSTEFTATKVGTGDYVIDLGFAVDTRFFSLGGGNATNTMCTDTNGAPGCAGTTVNANQLEVLKRSWAFGGLFDTKFSCSSIEDRCQWAWGFSLNPKKEQGAGTVGSRRLDESLP